MPKVQCPGPSCATISERRGIVVPGAANALAARIAEDVGFEIIYVTGAGIANTSYGAATVTWSA